MKESSVLISIATKRCCQIDGLLGAENKWQLVEAEFEFDETKHPIVWLGDRATEVNVRSHLVDGVLREGSPGVCEAEEEEILGHRPVGQTGDEIAKVFLAHKMKLVTCGPQ